ncbi:MAG: C69 family dipeptidase [Candidatus Omnitrophota bacterium]
MGRKYIILLIAAAIVFSYANFSSACTTTLVTKGASADGSVMVSHSDDDELGDQRIIYVPAADHKPGSKRPVYYDEVAFETTRNRYIGTSRGPGYDTPGPKNIPIGYIDQVPHTYAYFDGNYGIMNEHQLMFGECTNGAKIELKPETGKRIFYSAELSRVALERCKTARGAVELMGELIDKYGYYGTGETLLVGDTKEGWVFEMACGTLDEKGGLWVARKIPDGEVFVAANEFRIREVDQDDPDMLYSANLFDVAEKRGWWKPEDGKLDWLKAVSNGEYNHPYYSLRRVWSVLRRVKPSADLSPWVEDSYTKAYPFSVKPDKKLTVQDVMALHRDHYEGTEFDMTQGLAAGPFRSPYRWIGKYDGAQNNVGDPDTAMRGAWERPLSVFYCGYMFVNQARGWLPNEIGGVCWLGLDKPYLTCFVPFYSGVADLPSAYQTGSTGEFNRNTAWWAFNFVANWAHLKFDYMKKDIIAKQSEIENREFMKQAEVDAKARSLYEKDPKSAKKYLTKYCLDNANAVVKEWWDLADMLIVKYNDGYINIPDIAQEVGYPEEWLKKAGYSKGPISYKKNEVE